MNKAPISFLDQSLDAHFNTRPFDVKGTKNNTTEYYKRLLYTKLYSVLEFVLPDEWQLNYFRLMLYHYGCLGVIYTNEYGWIMHPFSIEKLDIYYNPSVIRVYDVRIDLDKTGIVGINAGIVRAMDDYYGLDDIITRYAVELANLDKAIDINLMNCNTSLLFKAENKKQADAIKEAYGRATEGEPMICINKELIGEDNPLMEFMPAKDTYIVDQLLDARRGIINSFLTEIGIRNANYSKKERLNSQEVEENNDETKAIISVIYKNIKESFDKINAISDLHLGVRYAFDYSSSDNKEVEVDG